MSEFKSKGMNERMNEWGNVSAGEVLAMHALQKGGYGGGKRVIPALGGRDGRIPGAL